MKLYLVVLSSLFFAATILPAAETQRNQTHSIEVSLTSDQASRQTKDIDFNDGTIAHVERKPFLRISDFTKADVSLTEGQIVLNITLTDAAAKRLRSFSEKNVGKRMAFIVDGKVIKTPTIKDPIMGKGFLIGPLEKSQADALASEINNSAPTEPYETVHFPSGKLTLGGELFKPKGPGPFPAVLYNHGSAGGMLSDMASKAMGPLYVAKGWVFFFPYRRGQGLSSSAGPYVGDQIDKAEKKGGKSLAAKTMIQLLTGDHLDDQIAALAWLKNQKFVQGNRIAVAGQSFGGIETVLGAEKYPYCAAVDASGGAMSWQEAPELHDLLKQSVRDAKSPIFFFQAENDFDLGPSKDLYREMVAVNKPAQIKIYPSYGKTHFDGHSFTWLGSSTWFEDVFSFIQKNCP